MINIGLAGTWHVHFEGYANEVSKNSNCKITALWDKDENSGTSSAAKYNCDYEKDLDTFLSRKDVDAIIVCSSTDLHKEIIIKAAKAGKHIFTEKVLCFNQADAQEVADAVKENNVKFTISFPWMSRSDFIWVKKSVDEGLFGDVTYCRMRNAHNGASGKWLPETFYDRKTCGGGAMMDLGAHSMYILNWIMGEPISVSSAFTNVMVDSVEDNAVTVMRYANGAIAVSETSFVSPNNPYEFELSGTKGTALMGGFLDKPCYNIGNGWVFPSLPVGRPGPMTQWIDSIMNGTESYYDIDKAVALSKTMEMAYKSII
ncbi:MAG: Gfo/Idh/MocA family oxidoreductase [Clostridia bacterium]|nr:Gfo/Idh/MocA family oxidoreductase [Clostridia bacterium]